MRMRGCIKIVVNTDETDETDKTDLNTLDYQGMLKQEICENLFNPLDLRCKRKIKNKYFCDEQKLTEKGR